MSLTAAEVVRHAAPITRLIGLHGMEASRTTQDVLLDFGDDGLDATELPADRAAALILGLIVARIDTTMEMDYVGLMIQQVYSDLMRCATFDSKDRIGSRFRAFCHAYARANGIEPATETKENP